MKLPQCLEAKDIFQAPLTEQREKLVLKRDILNKTVALKKEKDPIGEETDKRGAK